VGVLETLPAKHFGFHTSPVAKFNRLA